MLTGMLLAGNSVHATGKKHARAKLTSRAPSEQPKCDICQVRHCTSCPARLPEESRMACAPIAPPSPAPRKKNGGLVERVDTTSLRPRASPSLRIHVEDREYLLVRSAVCSNQDGC